MYESDLVALVQWDDYASASPYVIYACDKHNDYRS